MLKKYRTLFVLLLILILASFFRFYNLKSAPPGLYPDEAMNGNNALEAIKTGKYKIFYPENNGREGLFINIQAGFLKLFLPNSNLPQPWMLRIPSAIFGVLTVLGLFFLTRELFKDSKLALFTAADANFPWSLRFRPSRPTMECPSPRFYMTSLSGRKASDA